MAIFVRIHVVVHVCLHKCAPVRYWGRVSHWTWSSHIYLAGWPTKLQRSSCAGLCSMGFVGSVHGCLVWDSDLYACAASTLLTKPSPQPIWQFQHLQDQLPQGPTSAMTNYYHTPSVTILFGVPIAWPLDYMPTLKLPRSHCLLKAPSKNIWPFQLRVEKVSNKTTHHTIEILQEESWQQTAASLARRTLISW